MLPRCPNGFLLKISLIQSASFHHTPTSFQKWKNKWNTGVNSQQPSKTYIKYKIRQKRADAKRALNDLLFNYGSTKFEDVLLKGVGTRRWGGDQPDLSDNTNKKDRSKSSARPARKAHHRSSDGDQADLSDGTNKKDRSKSSAGDAGKAHHRSSDGDQDDFSDSTNKKDRSKSSARNASKARHRRLRRKLRRENFFGDFDEYPGRIFEETFGHKWYTWSFEASSQSSMSGFEWRENTNWTRSRNKEWNTAKDDGSYVVGSCSDRSILGLPLKGQLKIEEVKNAFRVSALKWHPDKHPGPSQATAEERFKTCVNAYKSLCNALS